jgi:hypothetical protein
MTAPDPRLAPDIVRALARLHDHAHDQQVTLAHGCLRCRDLALLERELLTLHSDLDELTARSPVVTGRPWWRWWA